MSLGLKRLLSVIAVFAPQVLALTPLAPIAGNVANGIAEAAAMVGKSNAEKLEHVKAIALESAHAANNQAGRIVVDPSVVSAVSESAINTAYQVAKLVHASDVVQPVPVG